MKYTDKLSNAVKSYKSTLCVGLDPVPERIINYGINSVIDYCSQIIELTLPFTAAYKPNYGFFEALGDQGISILNEIVSKIPSDKIIVADAKRGDIGSTAIQYRTAIWEVSNSDAVTLNPLMGLETLTPFLDDETKGIYALCLTSNPGANDFFLQPSGGKSMLSELIAERLNQLQSTVSGTIGMVVGATQMKHLNPVLNAFSDAPLLIPGVGKQGGNIADLTAILKNHKGIPLINVTRSIIYPESTKNWEQQVETSAKSYRDALMDITCVYL